MRTGKTILVERIEILSSNADSVLYQIEMLVPKYREYISQSTKDPTMIKFPVELRKDSRRIIGNAVSSKMTSVGTNSYVYNSPLNSVVSMFIRLYDNSLEYSKTGNVKYLEQSKNMLDIISIAVHNAKKNAQ